MNFEFTEEEILIRAQLKRLCKEQIASLSEQGEEEENQDLARKMIKAIGSLGVCGYMVPTEYGGVGINPVGLCIVREEVSKISSQADQLYAELGLSIYAIATVGSEENKEKYLPKVASGKVLGSFALTEPSAGSDVAAIQTKAQKDSNYYILNGEKTFASVAGLADYYLVIAKTNPSKGKKGLSAFVIDAGTPGLHISKFEMMAGIPEYSITLEDCRIPKSSLVGSEGGGWDIVFSTLGTFRVSVGAAALGLAQAAFEEAMKYANTREAFGSLLAGFQGTQFKLAEMATEIEAARWLVYRAAHLTQKGDPDAMKFASMAKLFATEMSCRVADQAVQIHGGMGVTRGVKVERLYREARLPRIYEGASEIQKLVIYRALGDIK